MLRIRTSTPSYMVYGEIGKIPIESLIKEKMIKFCGKLFSGKPTKVSALLLKALVRDTRVNNKTYSWTDYIKKILDDTGFSFLWHRQTITEVQERTICQIINDQAIQNIHSFANDSGKGRSYIFLKNTWTIETYLTTLDVKKTIAIVKFRTGNHKFPIETGRYASIRPEDRKCPHCVNSVGDEMHYLLECRRFKNERKKYINEKYYKRPNMYKFRQLMNITDTNELSKLGTFVDLLIKKF